MVKIILCFRSKLWHWTATTTAGSSGLLRAVFPARSWAACHVLTGMAVGLGPRARPISYAGILCPP